MDKRRLDFFCPCGKTWAEEPQATDGPGDLPHLSRRIYSCSVHMPCTHRLLEAIAIRFLNSVIVCGIFMIIEFSTSDGF